MGGNFKTPAWQRKEGKNPEGGLNARGRASYNAQTGGTLKAPVRAGDNPRRASFLARMGNANGAERNPDGSPTRLLLSLQAWGASSKADARAKAKAISARNIRRNPVIDSNENIRRPIPLSQRFNPRSSVMSNPVRKRQQEQIDIATLFYTGKISSSEFERRTDALNKPTVFNKVPEPASYDDIVRALGERKAGTRFKRDLIVEPDEFDLSDYLDLATSEAQRNLMEQGIVSVRLDIPAYEDHDVWVIALHTPSTTLKNPAGIAIGYTSVARIRSVRFGMSLRACENIAMGKSKSTIAYMQGVWISQSTEQIFELAQNVVDDWIQIGMNPARRCYFYQKKNLQPVTSASEVVQVGGMVLAKSV